VFEAENDDLDRELVCVHPDLLGHNASRLRDAGSVSPQAGSGSDDPVLCARPPRCWSPLVTLGVLALLLCRLAVFETAASRMFRRERRAR
jgi:hypothetical protein